MKTIIAGSREGFTLKDIDCAINQAGMTGLITEVVCGGARGVDKLGAQWALNNSIPIQPFPADWNTLGKRAGYVRNEQMAEYADAAVVLWDGVSKGTGHMIKLAEKYELRYYVHLVRFFDRPTPPARSMYINAHEFRIALKVYEQWEESMEEQGIRFK
jgi:hypothetical protein